MLAMLADYVILHHHEEMYMLGHDDIVLNGDHGIAGVDGGEELVLHHLADGGECRVWGVGRAIGGGDGAHHCTEWMAEAVCHMHGDVVDAGARVVMSRCAAGHAVLCGLFDIHS